MIPDGRCGLASGRDDCERLDFFVNGDPDFPDMNRLFTDCVWDADTQRWERKKTDGIVADDLASGTKRRACVVPVSYTHLTLPTIYSV